MKFITLDIGRVYTLCWGGKEIQAVLTTVGEKERKWFYNLAYREENSERIQILLLRDENFITTERKISPTVDTLDGITMDQPEEAYRQLDQLLKSVGL